MINKIVRLFIMKSSINHITPDEETCCGKKANNQIRNIPLTFDNVTDNSDKCNTFADIIKVFSCIFSLFLVHLIVLFLINNILSK